MKKTYAHHQPTGEALTNVRVLRQAFSDLHEAIVQNAPESRERAVALTHLETAAMWAIKARVCNDPLAQVEA